MGGAVPWRRAATLGCSRRRWTRRPLGPLGVGWRAARGCPRRRQGQASRASVASCPCCPRWAWTAPSRLMMKIRRRCGAGGRMVPTHRALSLEAPAPPSGKGGWMVPPGRRATGGGTPVAEMAAWMAVAQAAAAVVTRTLLRRWTRESASSFATAWQRSNRGRRLKLAARLPKRTTRRLSGECVRCWRATRGSV